MSLSRIFSRLTASAIIATVGFSAMFVSPDTSVSTSSGNTGVHFGLSTVSAAADPNGTGTAKTPDPNGTGTAATPAAAGAKKDTVDQWGDNVVTFANFALEVLYAFLIPLTLLAGWLLSPDWTFGDIFGLRTVIHSLWILISNIVYIVFAFSLVAIAFVNIYSGGGNFAIKKALPRFLIGVLIVPFTWFIVSATLSVSNVLTASVLRLPYDMMTPEQRSYELKIPKNCTLKFSQISTKVSGKIFECEKGKDSTNTVKLGDFLAGGKSTYNIITAYAYSVFSIDTLKEISGDKIKTLQSILNGGIQLIVGIICFLVFAILLVALCFALFTRAFYMWVMAVFSPLFGLFYFFDGKMAGAKKIEDKIWFTKFIGLAMVPVFVSAALSFWLLFLTMTQNVDLSKSISASSYWDTAPKGDKSSTTFTLGKMSNGNPVMDIKVEWLPLYVDDATTGAGTAVKLGQNAIGKIIISILGIVVLWMAVMAALSSSDITKAAVAPIEGFGKSIADMAKAIPQNIPLIPTGKWAMSMQGLQQFWSGMASGIKQSSNEWWSVGTNVGASFMGKELSKDIQEQNDLLRKLPTAQATATKDAMEWILAKTGAKDGKINDPAQREMVAKAVEAHNNNLFNDPSKADQVKKDAAAKIRAGDITGGLSLLEGKLQSGARVNGATTDGHINVTELDELAKRSGSAAGENTATPAAGGDAASKRRDEIIGYIPTKDITPGKWPVTMGNTTKEFMITQDSKDPKKKHIAKTDFDELAKHLGVADSEKEILKEGLAGKWVTVE